MVWWIQLMLFYLSKFPTWILTLSRTYAPYAPMRYTPLKGIKLIHQTKSKINFYLLFYDVQKAFDSVPFFFYLHKYNNIITITVLIDIINSPWLNFKLQNIICTTLTYLQKFYDPPPPVWWLMNVLLLYLFVACCAGPWPHCTQNKRRRDWRRVRRTTPWRTLS